MEVAYLLGGMVLGGLLVYVYFNGRLKAASGEQGEGSVSKATYDLAVQEWNNERKLLTEAQQTIQLYATDIATLKEREVGLEKRIQIFQEQVEEMKITMKSEFKNLATEIMDEKRKSFVEENKKEMTGILEPLKTDLGAFKQKIDDNREKEISEYTSLKKEIDSLQKLNQQLSDDAKSLATALKGDVKIQGNWGEDRLLTILEAEGLQEHIDYGKEVSVNDEEWKRQRPDFVVNIPGGRCLVIDSKVSLTAYAAYFNAESIEVKKQALQEHLKSVKNHIELLSGKNYQSIFGAKSPDYTFLFMPIEGALTLALNEDPSLFESAMKKQIVLVTPTNLISTLKIVKMMWQRDNQSKQVEEVFRYSGDLYNKFLSILEDLNRMENALNAAQKSFQDFKNGLSAGATRGATVLGKMEKIGTLQSKYNKTLPENYRRELDALPEEITTKGFNASAVDIDDAQIETEDHEPEE